MSRFCGVAADAKAMTTRASHDANTRYPNDVKRILSMQFGLVSDGLPPLISQLDRLGPVPVKRADRAAGALSRELTRIRDLLIRAKRDIDAVSPENRDEIQRILLRASEDLGSLESIPMKLIVVEDAVRAAGDATPACYGILDKDTPRLPGS